MEQTLGNIIIPIGWIILVLGTIWVWTKSRSLAGPAKIYFSIALISFYVLGYTSTVYWLGFSWAVGVIPALIVFLVLFMFLIKTVLSSESLSNKKF